jgi:hypothetical protein
MPSELPAYPACGVSAHCATYTLHNPARTRPPIGGVRGARAGLWKTGEVGR